MAIDPFHEYQAAAKEGLTIKIGLTYVQKYLTRNNISSSQLLETLFLAILSDPTLSFGDKKRIGILSVELTPSLNPDILILNEVRPITDIFLNRL